MQSPTSEHIPLLYKQLNEDLANLFNWCKANKLILNSKKTHYMAFGLNKVKHKISEKHLFIGQNTLTRVNKTTFLGIVVNEKLQWDDHINKIYNKLSSGLYVYSH